MSAIFRHGMRYEFLPRIEEANPMKYVRQSGKRQHIPLVLEVGQFQELFAALQQRERTMVLLDCGSGLRRGELIGLKWNDIDLAKKQMNVTRSVVKMVAGDVKTEASRKAVPLDDFMIEELLAWYQITPYKRPEDRVFASNSLRAGMKRDKQPYWPSTIMRYFIQPVARRLGIGNINWHTFRHTYSTLLRANGRSESCAGIASAFVHQDSDGRLYAGCNCGEAASSIESSADDRAERSLQWPPAAGWMDFGSISRLTLHTVT